MTQPTRIYRLDIPVNDRPITYMMSGPIVAFGCRHNHLVDVWFWKDRPGDTAERRTFQVYGTGHPITPITPRGRTEHRATVIAPGGHLVWHVIEHLDADTLPLANAPADLPFTRP